MKQIKLTGNRLPTVRHSGGGAQSGNLAQGTRNHRSASARTQGGRSSAAIPDVETQQEPEIDYPAEIQVSMSAICEEGSGATRPYIPETASQYATADRPETTAAFPASQEIVFGKQPKL